MLPRGSDAVFLTGQDVKAFVFVHHPLQSGYVGRIDPAVADAPQEMLNRAIPLPVGQGEVSPPGTSKFDWSGPPLQAELEVLRS
jgi:hypothetical protein